MYAAVRVILCISILLVSVSDALRLSKFESGLSNIATKVETLADEQNLSEILKLCPTCSESRILQMLIGQEGEYERSMRVEADEELGAPLTSVRGKRRQKRTIGLLKLILEYLYNQRIKHSKLGRS